MGYFTKTDKNGIEKIRIVRTVITSIIGLIALVTIIGMFNSIKIGYVGIYENSLSGTRDVVHGPNFVLKMPIFGNLEVYKKDTTLSFAPSGGTDDFTSTSLPIRVAFADTYKAQLLVNARMVLPHTDEEMLALHSAFRTYDNLVQSLYTKTLVDVAVNTTTQFTAEEVFQGGLNGLKSAIEDQANKGVYVTRRMKVLSESGVTNRAPAGAEKTHSGVTHKEVYVWKAVPLRDAKGEVRRTKNPLKQYGVRVTQVNLAEPIPEKLLSTLLDRKKKLVAEKIASIQEQENAKTEIETAKLQGEASRVKAEQKQLVIADAAIIEQKKNVDIAKQIALKAIVERQKFADLAIIDKKKELQIATAEENIQKANERAAKFKAQATLHNGLANAEVKKAMYNAVRKDILILEVEKVTQLALAEAFKSATINMPENVTIMNTKGDSKGASLQELTNFSILGMKNALSKPLTTQSVQTKQTK